MYPHGRILLSCNSPSYPGRRTQAEPDEARAQFVAILGDSGRGGGKIPPNVPRLIKAWGSTLGIRVTCVPIVQPFDEGDRAT
eukprot:scaffold1800_cov332-Pavlova_lutheri.AAC.24